MVIPGPRHRRCCEAGGPWRYRLCRLQSGRGPTHPFFAGLNSLFPWHRLCFVLICGWNQCQGLFGCGGCKCLSCDHSLWSCLDGSVVSAYSLRLTIVILLFLRVHQGSRFAFSQTNNRNGALPSPQHYYNYIFTSSIEHLLEYVNHYKDIRHTLALLNHQSSIVPESTNHQLTK
jgi:hypothetical protein